MNSKLSAILIPAFESHLLELAPSFAPFATTLDRGVRVFSSEAWEGITAYVLLVCDAKKDRFGVEIAWNLSAGTFPYGARQYAFDRNAAPVDGGIRMRIETLMAEREVWWDLEPAAALFKKGPKKSPKAEGLIEAEVAGAVKAVLDHAIKYFGQAAGKWGSG